MSSKTNSAPLKFTGKASESEDEDEEVTTKTTSLNPSTCLQKNIAGKLSSKFMAKVFIKEKNNQRLDNLHKLVCNYSSKKDADKLIKAIIKTSVKSSILYRSELFNEDELQLIKEFQNQFRLFAESSTKLYQTNSKDEQSVLIRVLKECQNLSHKIISTHLANKYHAKIDFIFDSVSNLQFIEQIFDPLSKANRLIMKEVVDDLNSQFLADNSF
ncbi:unnamed protein product [Adineta ricciae]|uniref:Tumor necrosis factor alpha-induced protein 8-like protein n=1 Tax=Adineta ricciae TaxID=249248 RepID=A0A815JKT1_ADIRI|nr:unnamed protein product [Adineta ricciae]CAF1491640.1 unnamed protein product [Adineta ricciae]